MNDRLAEVHLAGEKLLSDPQQIPRILTFKGDAWPNTRMT